MVQSSGIQKLVSKRQTNSEKSKKLKSDEFLSKKTHSFSQLNYTQWIYLTLLLTTCVQIHQISYVIFETGSHFSHQLLCIFLAQTLHTFHKSSPSQCNFSDFPTAQVKADQIFYVIFQIKSQLFFKVQIFFQCHEIVLLYFLSCNFIYYL